MAVLFELGNKYMSEVSSIVGKTLSEKYGNKFLVKTLTDRHVRVENLTTMTKMTTLNFYCNSNQL